MSGFKYIICFILVLLMATVPVTATSTTISGDSITSVSPAVGQKGNTVTVTITGLNFTSTTGSVRLEKSGDSDIDGTITSWGVGQIICKFAIKTSRDTGKWDVVVVKGYDDTVIVGSQKFAVTDEVTITSITPESGQAGDDVDFTIAGKDFDEDMDYDIFLYNSNYDNITADDVTVKSSTKITGTFEIDDDADEATYQVCILDEYDAVTCKKSAFKVTTNKEGTIDIASNPSGASIYIDDIANGTTPKSVDILVGSHKVTLKKTGYQDWGKIVNVEEDETTEIDATLSAAATATPTPTQSTPRPTTPPTTVRTTIKSTLQLPTTWADTPTTAAESPVDPVLIAGSVALAFIALRKR
jgi:hypothetical protein